MRLKWGRPMRATGEGMAEPPLIRMWSQSYSFSGALVWIKQSNYYIKGKIYSKFLQVDPAACNLKDIDETTIVNLGLHKPFQKSSA